MNHGRVSHGLIRLANGQVLVAGGYDGTAALSQAELYGQAPADAVPPTLAVLNPADGSYVNSLAAITGTASDNAAVAAVAVSMQDGGTGKYWNGSSWASGRSWLNADVFPSSWSYTNLPAPVDGSTYTVTARAMDTAGNWSAAYSTSTFVYVSDIPAGCGSAVSVKQDGTRDFTTIQGAVDALNKSLSVDVCVVVRDTQTYNEQVTVQGFVNNGYRLKIMADPALPSVPVVSPPAASTAAFRILGDSVTVKGFVVAPVASVPYGIQVTSLAAEILGVSVVSDGGIFDSGVSLSSGTVMSYATVTVNNAAGLSIYGSGNAVSHCSVSGGYSLYGYSAVKLAGAYHNSIDNCSIYSSSSVALTILYGGNNRISLSTVTSSVPSYHSAEILVSTQDIVDSSYFRGSGGLVVAASTGVSVANSSFFADEAVGSGITVSGGSADFSMFSSTVSGGASGSAIMFGYYNTGSVVLSSIAVIGGGDGLHIEVQPALEALTVSGLTFAAMSPAATAINFQPDYFIYHWQPFISTFAAVSFASSDIGTNVNAASLAAGTKIIMDGYSGARGGSAYENDPSGFVDWVGEDAALPAQAILSPADGAYVNSLAAITGTAADNVAVASVTVSIKRLSDANYWNGAGWTAAQAWLNAVVLPSSWTYAAVPVWVDGSSYTVAARAMDSSFNFSAGYSTSTFVFDGAAPVSAVTSPAGGSAVNSLSGISGTAADSVSGVMQVWVKVRRGADGYFWNGALSQWTSTAAWNFASGTSAWTYVGLTSSSLSSGGTYYAVSRAADAAGNVQSSEALTSTFTYVIPGLGAAPFGGVGSSSLTVNWATTFIPGTLYYLRLSTAPDASLAVFAATDTASSHDFTGLTPDTTYYGYVSTSAAAGYMLTDFKATLAEAPSSPAFSQVAYSSFVFTWAAGANPSRTRYQYDISTSPSFSPAYQGAGPLGTVTITNAAEGTTYYARVNAINAAGIPTAYAEAAPAVTLVHIVPPPAQAQAPAGSALGTSSITWSWAGLAGAAGYRVYPATAASSLLASPATASYVQSGLAPNTTYSIIVAGVSSGGEGQASPAAAPVATLAAEPSGLVAAVYATSATLSWGLNGNPAGTSARVQVAGGATSATSDTSFTSTGLLGCTSYYFRVWNVNADGISTQYGQLGPLLTGSPVPPPPGGLYAQPLPVSRIYLSWEPAPFEGITGYNLYYDNGTGTIDYGTPLASLTALQTSYTTGVLTSSAAYRFGLRAVHRCGAEEKNTSVTAMSPSLYSITGVKAAIKVPQTGRRVNGNSVTVMAELVTGTIAEVKHVRLQYKASSSGAWLDIPAKDPAVHPNPDATAPYFVHWDVTALAPGSYDLRAVATDNGNTADASPAAITITVDAVEPEIVESASGGKVTKQQVVNNLVANTLQAADSASAQVTKVIIPAGALDYSTSTVSVTNDPPLAPPAPDDAEPAGVITEVTLANQSALAGGQTAEVTLAFPDADNDGIVDGTNLHASELEMYSAHSAAGPWQRDLSSVVDLAAKKVTGHTTHFSFFALFAPQAANLNSARAYPVPWKPGSGGKFDSPAGVDGIIFDNLTDKAEIRIFTIAGQLVRKLSVTAADSGFKVWDGNNSSGRKAGSGVYIVHIKSGSRSKVLKIAVER
ncbi:MAG: Ig-like domain-containing protein [Elusimicrobia bacterium]|nr:Ig-like domain-containing protein [Elusimicrobiota bacterium]